MNFALDDYGMGYSNTSSILQYPFHTIKLDKSIVWAAMKNDNARKLLHHTIAMFKDMGMDNGTLALLTSLIIIPWVIKPLWSPFVDIFRSKRWWIVTMQFIMLAAIALVAFSVRLTTFTLTLVLFIIAAFAEIPYSQASFRQFAQGGKTHYGWTMML